jgi:dihydropteroate synthase
LLVAGNLSLRATARHQQPATSNKLPATSNEQPAMPTYSFRKLHLITRRDVLAEFGAAIPELPESLVSSLQYHPYLFKVLARPEEFPAELGAELKKLGARFRPITSNTGYIFADLETLQELAQASQLNSPETKIFAAALSRFLRQQQRDAFVLPTKPQPLQISNRALIMGVLNCTPDSFYDGGRYFSHAAAIAHGQRLAEAGADIIDVGGESTRPKGVYGGGAEPVSAEEEKSRVLPVIAALAKTLAVPLSIDTYKAEVAAAAVQAGAGLVNDISGFQFDAQMPETVARLGVPVVIMHTKGGPADMQSNPVYGNLLDELYLYFEEQIALARAAGIAEDRLIIDPGLGFGKRVQDNYEILRRLPEFRGLGCPILVGPSRKSFVGKALNLPPEQRLEGTAAAVAAAVMSGAHLIRVHDVMEMRRVATIAELVAGRTELQ